MRLDELNEILMRGWPNDEELDEIPFGKELKELSKKT